MKRFGRAMMAGAAVLALLGAAVPGRAQTATVVVAEENFRSEPRGAILAELAEGARLSLGEARGDWREVTLEAWIWGRSVHEQSRPDLDLLVNADGENLRDSPNGTRIGRALGGMRLARLEDRGDWLRVRRTGWIWSASIAVDDQAGARAVTAESAAPRSSAPDDPRPTRGLASVMDGAIILDQPGGDTVARLRSGTGVEVVARDGEWTRVRVEGWTLSGDLGSPGHGDEMVLTDLPRDSLDARPDAYRGRLVEWSVQFIALQEAERFRTDFTEGEAFLLTRGPGDDPGFVYVAVPPALLAEVERLPALRRIRVLGRIRAVRSVLTGAPVLELIEITGR